MSTDSMDHQNVNMPAAVGQELDLLLATIKRAITTDEAERAGIRLKGSSLGLSA
jgi:hypothetical protein